MLKHTMQASEMPADVFAQETQSVRNPPPLAQQEGNPPTDRGSASTPSLEDGRSARVAQADEGATDGFSATTRLDRVVPAIMPPRQQLRALTDSLDALLGYLVSGEQIPDNVLRTGDELWTLIDLQPPAGNRPIAYPLEGEGNLLRKILYAVEHGRPVDEETVERARAWVERLRNGVWL